MYFEASDLLEATSGLGRRIDNPKQAPSFEKSEHCVEYLNDIVRMLRRDNPETKDVLKQLGAWSTLQKDLIPLIITYRSDKELILPICRLLVHLTLPAQPKSFDVALQVSYLQQYKEAFLSKEVLTVIVGFLAEPLEKGERTEDDDKFIELVLTLYKNLLSIPDPAPSRVYADTKTNMHEDLVTSYDSDHILELLIVIAHGVEAKANRKWNVLLLEIVVLLLKRETPEGLWEAVDEDEFTHEAQNQRAGPAKGSSKLGQLMRKEKEQAKVRAKEQPLRNPRFGGVFLQTTATGKQQVITKPVTQSGLATATTDKAAITKLRTGHGRPKVPLAEVSNLQSSRAVRSILKRFCDQFLDVCYTGMMRSLQEDIDRENAGIMAIDRSNYLWLMKFFAGFHYISLQKRGEASFAPADKDDAEFTGVDLGAIGINMDITAFTFVIKKCEEYRLEKNWSDMEIAVGALTNLMQILHFTSLSKVPEARSYAISLETKLFYDRTLLLDKVVEYIRDFDASKQTKAFLVQYVHVIHVILEMLEGQAALFVKAKKAKKASKKTKPVANTTVGAGPSISTEGGEGAPVTEQPPPEEEQNVFRETRLDFNSYLHNYAHNAVISHYCFLLSTASSNTPELNEKIIHLFTRITKDCDLAPMFYQLSIFVTFQKILDDPLIRHRTDDDIISKFFAAAELNPYLFASVLFWKTRVDCLMINGGYSVGDSSDDERISMTKNVMDEWSPEEDKKAIDAFEMYKESETALDLVVAMLGENRTAAQVYKRLELLKVLSDEHKKMFAAAAKEAKHIRDPSEKTTSRSVLDITKKLAAQRSGRGPQAVEWLKEKIDEAAMLREKFAVFNTSNTENSQETSKCTPHEIIPTGEEELTFNKSVTKLMRKLGFTPPPRGKPFWVIPPSDNFTAAKLKAILEVLKEAQDEAQVEKEKAASEKEKKKKQKQKKEMSGFVVDDDDEETNEKENDSNNKMVLDTDSEDDKQKKQEKREKERKKRERERERRTAEQPPEEEEEPISEEEDGRRKSARRAEKKRKEKRKLAGFKRKVEARQEDSDGEEGSDEAENEATTAPETEHANKKRRLKKRIESEVGATESLDIAPPLSAEGIPAESVDIVAGAGDDLDKIFESQKESYVTETFDDSEEEVFVKKVDKKKKKIVEAFEDE